MRALQRLAATPAELQRTCPCCRQLPRSLVFDLRFALERLEPDAMTADGARIVDELKRELEIHDADGRRRLGTLDAAGSGTLDAALQDAVAFFDDMLDPPVWGRVRSLAAVALASFGAESQPLEPMETRRLGGWNPPLPLRGVPDLFVNALRRPQMYTGHDGSIELLRARLREDGLKAANPARHEPEWTHFEHDFEIWLAAQLGRSQIQFWSGGEVAARARWPRLVIGQVHADDARAMEWLRWMTLKYAARDEPRVWRCDREGMHLVEWPDAKWTTVRTPDDARTFWSRDAAIEWAEKNLAIPPSSWQPA